MLLTCSRDHPGVTTHLQELSRVMDNGVEFHPIEEFVSPYGSWSMPGMGYKIGKRLLNRISKASISEEMFTFGHSIIIGSWKDYYDDVIRQLNKHKILPSILWCSTLGQSEMSWNAELNPLLGILRLLRERKIRYLLVPEKTYESFSYIEHVVCLPHPVSLEKSYERNQGHLDGVNIDLFVKARPGKNVLQQMVAQRYSKAHYMLHTNINEQRILDIAECLMIQLKKYPWLKEKEYETLIGAMDLSLQVTWTESFNYAVCERMMMGVPTLVSPEVFLVSGDPFLKELLVVDTPDSPVAIAKKIDFLINNRRIQDEIRERARERVFKIAQKYNTEIKEKMAGLFSA